MHTVRIIPRLDIKGPNLVKGIHLEGLRVLGTPERFARYYYETGADELLYMDVVASLYGRNSLHEIVRKTSKEIFIPLTVGGGIRTIDDIQAVLRAGADKVLINTAAINDPELIKTASRKFGSSTIVISIEAIKLRDGSYEAYTNNGRDATGINPFDWASRAEELGAGELIVTSINQEGTGNGFDIDLVSRIAEAVSIPVVACGGAGKLDHVYEVLRKGHVDAVSIASLFHYQRIKEERLNSSWIPEEGNTEFVRNGKEFTNVQGTTILELKDYLTKKHIHCRYEPAEVAPKYV